MVYWSHIWEGASIPVLLQPTSPNPVLGLIMEPLLTSGRLSCVSFPVPFTVSVQMRTRLSLLYFLSPVRCLNPKFTIIPYFLSYSYSTLHLVHGHVLFLYPTKRQETSVCLNSRRHNLNASGNVFFFFAISHFSFW